MTSSKDAGCRRCRSPRSPTLIVHGTRDAMAEFYDGVRAHEHIEDADRYWIDCGDHLAFWLAPQAPTAQASARTFLNQHMKTRHQSQVVLTPRL